MKSKEDILKKLQEIESDERLSYPPANVNANAPLALIQTYLESTRNILKWILEDTIKQPPVKPPLELKRGTQIKLTTNTDTKYGFVTNIEENLAFIRLWKENKEGKELLTIYNSLLIPFENLEIYQSTDQSIVNDLLDFL